MGFMSSRLERVVNLVWLGKGHIMQSRNNREVVTLILLCKAS